MGNYAVPEEIRLMKPKGTMVKNISGHYYVYEFSSYRDENGKRKTKIGKCIGAIKPNVGFVPNDNYLSDSEITTLEYGDYAIACANSGTVLKLLHAHFNPTDANQIYVVSLIHALQGFTYLRDIKKYYDMSWLTLKFPGLKLGYDALCTLYDNLGRRQSQVLSFEQGLIDSSSREVAIDGHVIASQSDNNDLAEKGYKFSKLEEKQLNLMMAYDMHTEQPLLSRIYQGGLTDNISIRDFLRQVTMRDMLFIVDRGFYSLQNLALFNEGGNYYLIPVPSRMDICKAAELDPKQMERFSYASNRKATVIEYSVKEYAGFRVYAFRDKDEALLQESNYLRYLEQGKKGYTQEGLQKNREWFGVYILQTNLKNKSPNEIFGLYKKRWKIETFYNYFKNGADYNALYSHDYYKTQGLSFIMLISSLIHHELAVSTRKIKNKTTQECLLDARMIKLNKRNGVWAPVNCKAAITDMFRILNTPLSVS